MADKEHVLDKDRLLELMGTARERIVVYDEANRQNPRDPILHGTVDEVALEVLERSDHFVTTGVKLNGDRAKIVGQRAYPGGDGFIVLDGETLEYVLPGFRNGTTVSKFIESICHVVSARVDHGSEELRQAMMPNAKAYASRTLREITPYVPNGR